MPKLGAQQREASRYAMADIISQQTFVEQLKEFELPNVEFTGEKLRGGSGSYGYVEVVLIAGTRCAAKFSHQVFEEYQWKKSSGLFQKRMHSHEPAQASTHCPVPGCLLPPPRGHVTCTSHGATHDLPAQLPRSSKDSISPYGHQA